jgi:hypothetical protein
MTASVIELRQEKKEAQFVCSACGADRGCQCNEPAVPKAQKAIEALKANPEKSNRAIADEIGADKVIVDRARKPTPHRLAIGFAFNTTYIMRIVDDDEIPAQA